MWVKAWAAIVGVGVGVGGKVGIGDGVAEGLMVLVGATSVLVAEGV